jgi:hypothetical protein
MSAPGPVENPNKKPLLPVVFIIGLIVFVIFGILYTTAVLFGQITDKQKIDTINLSLIALVLLALLILSRPRMFEQLSLVEILGIKLQLNRVMERQAQQQTQLQDISLILPLLIPPSERKHLAELGSNQKNLYEGSSSLVQELRRLRSVGLVTGQAIHRLEHMSKFYLGEYIKLTEFGKLWVDRISEIEKAEKRKETDQV